MPQPTLNIFIASLSKWLMALTAERPVEGRDAIRVGDLKPVQFEPKCDLFGQPAHKRIGGRIVSFLAVEQ